MRLWMLARNEEASLFDVETDLPYLQAFKRSYLFFELVRQICRAQLTRQMILKTSMRCRV